jgi:hypothetical protein
MYRFLDRVTLSGNFGGCRKKLQHLSVSLHTATCGHVSLQNGFFILLYQSLYVVITGFVNLLHCRNLEIFLINMFVLLICGLFNGIVITSHYIKGKVVPIKHCAMKTYGGVDV